MESLITDGFFQGVLDMTTTEVSSHVLGSASSDAGPGRLSGAALTGIPQVLCPGAMDMVGAVNFEPFKTRQIYCHSEGPSHFRPNVQDNERVGAYFAEKLNQSVAPCVLFFPLKGLSQIGVEGGELYNPEADNALFDAIRKNLDRQKVQLVECDNAINDAEFAVSMAKMLDSLIKDKRVQK